MRLAGSWQVLLDDRILELFDEGDEEYLKPAEIAQDERIRHSRSYVTKRCRKLADHGLLQAVSQGVYRLTDEGRAYLRGEYDAETGAYVTESEAIQPDENGTEVG